MMSVYDLQESVTLFRRFNRFYTKQIGLLNQGLLKTRFPLFQARVLYELAQQDRTTASALVDKLNIDPGYLSRILSRFAKEGLIRKRRSRSDSRQRILKLTTLGKKSFAELDSRSRSLAEEILRDLTEEDRHRLLHAMQTIETVLDAETNPATSDGSSTATELCTHKNMILMKPLKPWSQKSWYNSFANMILSGNTFGLPSRQATESDRS